MVGSQAIVTLVTLCVMYSTGDVTLTILLDGGQYGTHVYKDILIKLYL